MTQASGRLSLSGALLLAIPPPGPQPGDRFTRHRCAFGVCTTHHLALHGVPFLGAEAPNVDRGKIAFLESVDVQHGCSLLLSGPTGLASPEALPPPEVHIK